MAESDYFNTRQHTGVVDLFPNMLTYEHNLKEYLLDMKKTDPNLYCKLRDATVQFNKDYLDFVSRPFDVELRAGLDPKQNPNDWFFNQVDFHHPKVANYTFHTLHPCLYQHSNRLPGYPSLDRSDSALANFFPRALGRRLVREHFARDLAEAKEPVFSLVQKTK